MQAWADCWHISLFPSEAQNINKYCKRERETTGGYGQISWGEGGTHN